jgi:Na+-translocating ferredoxin:NAD+ oxidoreductase subunit B
MSENYYEQLRELLDTHPVGCPYAPEIIEILKILFSEEEAIVALGLGFIPFNIEEIAYRTGIETLKAEEHLESLANKGLVFSREKNGVKKYSLLNAIQIFENPYRKGVYDEQIKKLTPLWKKYQSTSLPVLGGETTALLRVIPIEKKIKAGAEVLPYEKVYEMIETAKVLGISRCSCREFEQNCDSPREGCMHFGATCTYLVERGFGRYLSKDEMKQKLKEFDEMGLVRQVNNTSDRLEIICHCCPCCCEFLSALKDYDNPRAFTRSAFLPIRDLEKCVGCRICANQRCPMNAIEMIAEKPVVKIERCIGCGLCSTGCPQDAIRMERSVNVSEPPSSYIDLGMRLLQEKGKLEKFIEVNTPKSGA